MATNENRKIGVFAEIFFVALPLRKGLEGRNVGGQLIDPYRVGHQQSSSNFQAGSKPRSVGLAGPESAAAQRWSSTIGCPAWQPRPR